MKEEKTVSLKETFVFLIGNKWLYLIMFVSFLAMSLVGFNIASSSKREYSCFFDCKLAGFHSIQEEGYFVDGEMFDPYSLLGNDKLKEYLSVSYIFDGLTVDEINDKAGIKSFKFKQTYKESSNPNDGEGTYTLDKQGYELVFNPSVINYEQAKLFSQMISNEVLMKSNAKVEKLSYLSCLDSYNQAISYEKKIKSLNDAIKYLVAQVDSLKQTYGDFTIEAGKYGGSDNTYYLSSKTIDNWETQMKNDLSTIDTDSLTKELNNNGYIDPSHEEYVNYVKTEVESLNRIINVENDVLEVLRNERDAIIASAGSSENAQVGAFNEKIVALIEKIAGEQEQLDLFNLQLKKLDPTFIASADYATYSANLEAFENRLSTLRQKIRFYVVQYEDIAKKIMLENSKIDFDNSNVVTINAGIGNFAMLVYSLLIATFLPMAINGVVSLFKTLDSKPLFNFKSKK